ncbi:Aste57867_12253 [Aphanomyces stellatus]|uniref:Aste57867_12253 protein n=1 Tax=Aphanomyces stellatus TaxID=120398 RepID=A0A485KV26_9STRA|nr:hypothetical protein As57867_012208 [Aphanomyces stellatus]VFT89106.1 Aste57867_12253 [Aphanomyces stellatus]
MVEATPCRATHWFTCNDATTNGAALQLSSLIPSCSFPKTMYPTTIPALAPIGAIKGHTFLPGVAGQIDAGTPLDMADIRDARRVRRARKGLHALRRGPPLVTNDEVILAAIREHAIIAAHASHLYPDVEAPAWFLPAMEAALRPMQNRLIQEIRLMESRGIARAINAQLPHDTCPLHPVVATDGVVPPHFPATTEVLKALLSADVNELLVAYGQVPTGHLEARRMQLGIFLGLYHRFS